MTTVRTEWLAEKLGAFLERYNPPKDMLPRAQADETTAMVRTLERYAPQVDYAGWWARFADDLAEAMRTRTWPTVGDLAKVAQAMPKRAASVSDDGLDMAEHARRRQLRMWWAGQTPIAEVIVTRQRCLDVGMTDAQAADAIAFAANPANVGCDGWRRASSSTWDRGQ